MKKSTFYILNIAITIAGIAVSYTANAENAADPEVSNSPVQQPLEEPTPTASNSTSNASVPLEAKSSQGSNVRNYLESCDPSFRSCNAARMLVCEDSICKCMVDPLNPGDRLVYGSSSQKCLPKPTSKNGWACSDDTQCMSSSYGQYSRCNTTTGNEFSVCECFDSEKKGRKIALYKNVCYLKKELEETCSSHEECNASIQGEAECLGLDMAADRKGVCKCAERYEYEPTYNECLRLGFINSPCLSDFQCQHELALGPLSRCRDDIKKCQCWDSLGHGQKDTGFSGGRCYYRRGENQTCTQKIECELGYHKNAACMAHPSYNDENVCQCEEGYTCSASAVTVSIVTTMLSILHIYA
jgi:hypothetical protein